MTDPQDALERLVRQALAPAPARCPDELHLLGAAATEDLALGAHVASCPRCRAILRAATDDAITPLPGGARGRAMVHRAQELHRPGAPELLRLTVRAVGRLIELIDFSGEALTPAPARNATSSAEDGVLVRHRLAGRDVTTHVTSSGDGRFGILVDVWGERDESDRVRFTLLRGQRELASARPRSGRVQFPEVRAGTYRIVLFDEAGPAGELDVTLRDQDA